MRTVALCAVYAGVSHALLYSTVRIYSNRTYARNPHLPIYYMRICASMRSSAHLSASLRISALLCASLRISALLCAPLRISAHLCALMHIYAHLCTSMRSPVRASAFLLRSCARLSTSLRSPSHLCAPLRRAALCVLHTTKPTRTLYIHPLYMFLVRTRSSYLWTLL